MGLLGEVLTHESEDEGLKHHHDSFLHLDWDCWPWDWDHLVDVTSLGHLDSSTPMVWLRELSP